MHDVFLYASSRLDSKFNGLSKTLVAMVIIPPTAKYKGGFSRPTAKNTSGFLQPTAKHAVIKLRPKAKLGPSIKDNEKEKMVWETLDRITLRAQEKKMLQHWKDIIRTVREPLPEPNGKPLSVGPTGLSLRALALKKLPLAATWDPYL